MKWDLIIYFGHYTHTGVLTVNMDNEEIFIQTISADSLHAITGGKKMDSGT